MQTRHALREEPDQRLPGFQGHDSDLRVNLPEALYYHGVLA